MKITAFLILAILCSSCGQRFVPYSPATAVNKPDAHKRLRFKLVELGYEVDTGSTDDMITSSWRELEQNGSTFKMRFIILFDHDVIKITSQCKRKPKEGDFMDGARNEEDCGDRQPESAIAHQEQLTGAI